MFGYKISFLKPIPKLFRNCLKDLTSLSTYPSLRSDFRQRLRGHSAGSYHPRGVANSRMSWTGWARCGVTTMTSSVSSCWNLVELKSAPSIGMSPSHGTCDRLLELSDCNSPAMAKLCPLRSSIVVFALRTLIPGTVTSAIRTAVV